MINGLAAVAAGSDATADVVTDILQRGGNAVDAAVAGGFAAAVCEPTLTSLGGGGFALVRLPDGTTTLLDFFVDAPGRGSAETPPASPHFTEVAVQFAGARQEFHVGWGSVAVPGCFTGYRDLHATYGRLSLSDVVEPARHLAERGVPINASQHRLLELLQSIFALSHEGESLYNLHSGAASTGLLANPDYARFLDSLAQGGISSFASPRVADPFVTAMTEHGGLVTHADLGAYRTVSREPMRCTFESAEIQTNAPPSFGGSIVIDALQQLSADSQPSLARRMIDALRDATARQKARQVPQASAGTTHLSVIDHDGMAVSMTTSNGSCSGVFIPGTGIQLNNVLGERDLHPNGFHSQPPGTRIGSMMAPTLVELSDGTVVALGSGGSERIRSALLQVIVHIEGGCSLQEAIERPRLHWDGQTVQVEPGFDDQVLDELADGWPVNVWPKPDLYFGGVQAALRRPDGSVAAAGDPRRGGVGRAVVLPQAD